MAGFREYGLNLRESSSAPISADVGHLALSATPGVLHVTNASGGYAHLHVKDLYVDGVANVNAGEWFIDNAVIDFTLAVSGNAYFGSNINVNSNANISGDVLIGDDLSVWGDSYTAGNVITDGTLQVLGNISGSSNMNLAGNIRVTGNSTVSSNSEVAGNLTVSGSQVLIGNSTTYGNSIIDGTLLVDNNTSINGTMTITGATRILDSLRVDKESYLTNNVVATSNVGISGFVLVDKYLNVGGNISASSDLVVARNTVVRGNVGISGSESIVGDLVVMGNVFVTGVVNQGVTGTSDVTFKNNLLVEENVGISGNLTVGSTSNFLNDVNLETNMVVDGSVTIHTDLVVDGNATIQGIVNFDALGTLDNDFHVGQDIYAHDDLYVEDFAEISGALHIRNYTKNNLNGLHRNVNSGNITAEPGFAPYHSIFWVEGNPTSGNYLAHFYNANISGGFMKFENSQAIPVVTVEQTSGSDALMYINDRRGGRILSVTADQNEMYQVSLSGSQIIYNGFITCPRVSRENNNESFGDLALNTIGASASGNVAIGKNSLYNLVSGNNNIAIGYNSGANELGSNKLYIENSNSSNPLIYGEFDNDIVTIHGKLGIGTKTPNAFVTVVGNISATQEITLGTWQYFGDANTDGSWRFGIVAGNMSVEKRVTGSWVTKHTFV
jgi:predicted acyltransferase (DUF342 family)